METPEEIWIPSEEEMEEIAERFIEREAFLITIEWQERLRAEKNPLDNT